MTESSTTESDCLVSLVIPGRNCEDTIRQCLESVVPLLEGPHLREIIFVDDGSTDDTKGIVTTFAVTFVAGSGRGPGAARNLGWRRAKYPLVWFVDSDCVAELDALDRLLPEFDDAQVAGVSGSYGIMNSQSLLASLIHEEIIERHRAMPRCVDFAATFNVVYRVAALRLVDGFDERYLKAQDAELAFRVIESGSELRFVFESRVRHFHPSRWWSYLQTQRQHGYWRVWLHLHHRGHAAGDSYSSLLDHMQPVVGLATMASMPLAFLGTWAWLPAGLSLLFMMTSWPMSLRIVRRTGRVKYVGFALMSLIRALFRGVGMLHGLVGYAVGHNRLQPHDRC